MECKQSVMRAKRTKFTLQQIMELEELYDKCNKPSRQMILDFSDMTGLRLESIKIWLQNRRAKWRKIDIMNIKEDNFVYIYNYLPPLGRPYRNTSMFISLDPNCLDIKAEKYSSANSVENQSINHLNKIDTNLIDKIKFITEEELTNNINQDSLVSELFDNHIISSSNIDPNVSFKY